MVVVTSALAAVVSREFSGSIAITNMLTFRRWMDLCMDYIRGSGFTLNHETSLFVMDGGVDAGQEGILDSLVGSEGGGESDFFRGLCVMIVA
jgi:hypothetical protein